MSDAAKPIGSIWSVTFEPHAKYKGTYVEPTKPFPESPHVTFVHVVCWLCLGLGYVARDTFTAEHDERCTVCAGKGTIVTEREEES